MPAHPDNNNDNHNDNENNEKYVNNEKYERYRGRDARVPSMATTIEIQNDARMERLMSSDPKMARQLQKIIRKAIRAAARRVSQDARSVLGNDPRRAAAAVRSSVYRAILGGQVNILSPRRAAKKGSLYEPARTGREGQRGGNRVKRSARTEQMMSYTGADRGFILRWVESGTGVRTSRYGNRGSISARPWFTRSATSALETAAQEIVSNLQLRIKN